MFKTRGQTTGYTGFRLVAVLAFITLFICACVPITPVPAEQEGGAQEEAAQETPAPTEEVDEEGGEEAGAPTLEDVNWRLLEYLGGGWRAGRSRVRDHHDTTGWAGQRQFGLQ